MKGAYRVSKILHENCFSCLGGRNNQSALSLPERTNEIDDPHGGVVCRRRELDTVGGVHCCTPGEILGGRPVFRCQAVDTDYPANAPPIPALRTPRSVSPVRVARRGVLRG